DLGEPCEDGVAMALDRLIDVAVEVPDRWPRRDGARVARMLSDADEDRRHCSEQQEPVYERPPMVAQEIEFRLLRLGGVRPQGLAAGWWWGLGAAPGTPTIRLTAPPTISPTANPPVTSSGACAPRYIRASITRPTATQGTTRHQPRR